MEQDIQKTCPNCDKVITANPDQCPHCGTKIMEQSGRVGDLRDADLLFNLDEDEEGMKTENVRIILTAVIGILLIVGITGIGFNNIY